MTETYDFKAIEAKWQAKWAEQKLYEANEHDPRPKFYMLTMFPYPSGDLHIGHWFAMSPSDTVARFRRMQGYNVMFPIGFDAFGLPAENAAIKRGIHPHTWTMKNIDRMRGQLRSMGASFDWRREVVTCLPEYYKWNQWLFLQFYKAGLVYKKMAPVDWCPGCNTSLAREQVVGEERKCERCGTPVVRRDLEQWFFKITAYADQLLDFSGVIDWPERVKVMQRNWIGRSEGVQFAWKVKGHDDLKFEVFTTRPDTIYGVSFCVLAPEHPLVDVITAPEQREVVGAYKFQSSRRSEIERLSTERVRDGVFTGAYAVHPLTGNPVPIYAADYVLMSYGTGAIMAVPAHDERDFDFARRYNLPIPVVIKPEDWHGEALAEAYTGPGPMVNSGPYEGMASEAAWNAVADKLTEMGIGGRAVNYRIRDWLISRQRYWGTPIPMINCPHCGMVPVPEKDLPVELPMDVEFLPTGESPLKLNEQFLHTTCPVCGGPATRETDTMDTFVDSSWYMFRYTSPGENDAPFDPEKVKFWMPVDQYTGGVEHATMHLLYTRFFVKAMHDLGLCEFDEPIMRLFNQGTILGEDGEKMSKSRGNVVSPDDLVGRYGADTVRAYLMFMGPWERGGPWSNTGIGGVTRFISRFWRLATGTTAEDSDEAAPGGTLNEKELRRALHQTIKKVTEDMEHFGFNTVISGCMELVNLMYRARGTELVESKTWGECIDDLMLMMAPITPHITEELWHQRGHEDSIHVQPWPMYDESALKVTEVEIAVQVNGKVRARIMVPAEADTETARNIALADQAVVPFTAGHEVKNVVYVPGRLVNIVVK